MKKTYIKPVMDTTAINGAYAILEVSGFEEALGGQTQGTSGENALSKERRSVGSYGTLWGE